MRGRKFLVPLLVLTACGTKSYPDGLTDGSVSPGDGGIESDGSFDAGDDEPSFKDSGTSEEGGSHAACSGKCPVGHACSSDDECEFACGYSGKCVEAPSCATHLGGDTCGIGEVDQGGVQHESCCKSLLVPGFTDPSHLGKTVYVDKYEITAGRVREFVRRLGTRYGGNPNVKSWISLNRPEVWDDSWSKFLPEGYEGGSILIGRRLLGDPRVEDGTGNIGPGVILPPPTDEYRNLGINYQFNSEIYVDLHGAGCGTYSGSYGFPTFWYSPDILNRDGQLPRADGIDFSGKPVPAKELLDVKSMNCITNVMLAAFCAWDGGQLATNEVLDYITATPWTLGNTSGCGIQYDNHDDLLGANFSRTLQTGGRCANVASVNATFDAGDNLPNPGYPLNVHNYHYPDTGNVTHDKAWEVSAPGRASLGTGSVADQVRINPGDEPWADVHGNLNEAALDYSNGSFTGNFTLKYRGLGYGSARSHLNVDIIPGENVRRIQRPEAKAAFTGGRCMRFK